MVTGRCTRPRSLFVAVLALLAAESAVARADAYTSGVPAVRILDGQTAVKTVEVPDAFTVTDLDVSLRVVHPAVGQLSVTLRHPDGTSAVLIASSSAAGADLLLTTLDDEAAGPLSTGTAPFQGSFRPDSPLAIFDGKSAQGTWTLDVTDVQTPHDGALYAFSLAFNGLTLVYGGPAVHIPVVGHAYSSIQVPIDFQVADVDVSVDLGHTCLSDMRIYLDPPIGHESWFMSGTSCSFVPLGFVFATLDDEAPVPLTTLAIAPYTGRWDTVGGAALATHDATAALGIWTLDVWDFEFKDSGQLRGWILHFVAADKCLGVPATSTSYGSGLAGTGGVPGLALSATPAIGTSFSIEIGNSVGAATQGFVLVGNAAAAIQLLGGTLLVAAPQVLPVSIPASGLSLPVNLAADIAQCGDRVYLQVAELDVGAPQLVSFSAGLELVLGS